MSLSLNMESTTIRSKYMHPNSSKTFTSSSENFLFSQEHNVIIIIYQF